MKARFTDILSSERFQNRKARILLALAAITMFALSAGAPGATGH